MNMEVIGSLLRYAIVWVSGYFGLGAVFDGDVTTALVSGITTIGTALYMAWKRWNTKAVPAS